MPGIGYITKRTLKPSIYLFFSHGEIQDWGIPQNRLQVYQVNNADNSTVYPGDSRNSGT